MKFLRRSLKVIKALILLDKIKSFETLIYTILSFYSNLLACISVFDLNRYWIIETLTHFQSVESLFYCWNLQVFNKKGASSLTSSVTYIFFQPIQHFSI